MRLPKAINNPQTNNSKFVFGTVNHCEYFAESYKDSGVRGEEVTWSGGQAKARACAAAPETVCQIRSTRSQREQRQRQCFTRVRSFRCL
jgi:hypothetical protein